MPTRRLFVSFTLPPQVQQAVAAVRHRISPTLPARTLSWVEPSTLHVTLRFLGDVDAEAIPQLEAQLRTGLVGRDPIPVRCHAVAWLPGPRRPRVLYAHVSAAPGTLEDLHRRVREATAGVGVPEPDRPFVAHATLARIRTHDRRPALDWGRLIEPFHDAEFGAWTVESCQLMASELRPEGARHTVVSVIPLGVGKCAEQGDRAGVPGRG
jgi:2'-5' RNA ligase